MLPSAWAGGDAACVGLSDESDVMRTNIRACASAAARFANCKAADCAQVFQPETRNFPGFICRISPALFAEVAMKKCGYLAPCSRRFGGIGHDKVLCMRLGFINDQFGEHARLQQLLMHTQRVAQEEVACAGEQKGGNIVPK